MLNVMFTCMNLASFCLVVPTIGLVHVATTPHRPIMCDMPAREIEVYMDTSISSVKPIPGMWYTS